MAEITTTLYTVVNIKSEYNHLVLIKGNEDGVVSAKFLTYGLSGESAPVHRALQAVTGEKIDTKIMMQEAFIKLFGARIATEVRILD